MLALGAKLSGRGLGVVTAAAATTAAARGARAYTLSPAPTLRVAQAAALLHGRRAGAGRVAFRGATARPGAPQSEAERVASNAARRSGVLRLPPYCGAPAADAHFTFCCAARRPYVAVDRHNSHVVVDLRPLGGVAAVGGGRSAAARRGADGGAAAAAAVRAAAAARVSAGVAAARAFLASAGGGPGAPPPLVVNDAALRAQRAAIIPGAGEGGDAQRPAAGDAELTPTFTAYPSGRGGGDAGALASALADALARALALQTAGDAAAARAAVTDARAERWARLTTRRLTRLVADERAVRNLRVKAGALDGFAAALAAGRVGDGAALALAARRSAPARGAPAAATAATAAVLAPPPAAAVGGVSAAAPAASG